MRYQHPTSGYKSPLLCCHIVVGDGGWGVQMLCQVPIARSLHTIPLIDNMFRLACAGSWHRSGRGSLAWSRGPCGARQLVRERWPSRCSHPTPRRRIRYAFCRKLPSMASSTFTRTLSISLGWSQSRNR